MKKLRMVVMLGMAMAATTGWGKTVGLWKDARSGISDGMRKTLNDAGWQTVILQGKDLSDEAKLDGLDVVFLPGGHNAYGFADFYARRALVKYLAAGKGILAGGARSGYVRTGNRPICPQVGATYNRVNGPYLKGAGDSELAKAITQPFCPGGWDHLVVKVGPLGKVFAVNGDDPVGVYGEAYGGRYLVFGAFIGMNADSNGMQGVERQVLLKMLDWLAGAPKPGDREKAEQRTRADLEFLRREAGWDWTLNERGPDNGPGLLPATRNRLALELQSRQYTLENMGQHLSGKSLDRCRAAADELKKAVQELDAKFQKAMAETTARIDRMTIAELAAENPFLDKTNVMNRIAAVPGKTEAEKKAAMASGAGNPKAVTAFLHGGSVSEEFLPADRLKDLCNRGDLAIAELRPAVKAAKAERLAAERKRDAAQVPALIAQCASSDAAVRREAAQELGRIGSPAGTKTLIGLLKDNDDKVRIRAIQGLGWMQAKEAVPALIDELGGDDPMKRRRAAQALGQIGDARAIKPLLGKIADADYFTRENAILSLGWLKAKEAVPELLKMVTGFDRKDATQRGLMISAIRALGHIGDPAALPVLEELAKNAKDVPKSKRGAKNLNFYSTSASFGLAGHAELSIAEIQAGGLAEPGIRQADFLASKEAFYGMTRRFNALAGRPETFSGEMAQLWPHLWEAGMTGIHMAWGAGSYDPEKLDKALTLASDLDLRWINVLPMDESAFYASNRPHGTADKNGVEAVLMKYKDESAFHGFWAEEVYPTIAPADGFEPWLKRKYGDGFRKTLGVADGQNLLEIAKKSMPPTPVRTEYLLYCAANLLEYWREDQEWISGMRKGCAFTWVESDGIPLMFPGVTGGAGGVIDVNGPENYQSFGRHNAFAMEMYKNGEARPVMSEFYNWYSPSSAHEIRGFAQHLMHGECYYAFDVSQIFEQASTYWMWTWDASRWGNLKTIFQKARKIRDYLEVPASAANVAMVLSELSAVPFYEDFKAWSMERRWMQHQGALWTALNQSQVPTDLLWAETMTPEKLGRYKVIVLADAKIVTDGQAEALRNWVRDGGVLIASGTTSLFGPWTDPGKNYLLADLFGVDYGKHVGVDDPGRIDTYCIKIDQAMAKAVSGLDPENYRHMVHREIKPVKSLGRYTAAESAAAYLPGIATGTAVEYDMPLGYDQVKPGAAEVLARFSNGDPALTVNKVGKGLCFFWTPVYPGLCHIASRWEMQPNRYEFWPNVRELLAAMVKGGLAHAQATLPVDVTGVSTEVEVTVRQQPEKNRMMVHLLDYDTNSAGVKGAVLTVHAPAGRTVKRLFYPDTDTEVQFAPAEGGVTAKLRDFDVHDMVVIEWQTKE